MSTDSPTGTTGAATGSDARSVILARVRASLQDGPRVPEIPRAYRRRSELSRESIIEMFEDRLIDYKAAVFRENLDSLPQRLAQLLDRERTAVPAGLDPGWLPEGLSGVRDQGPAGGPLSARELNEVTAVVTSSTVSCAETGTIFLNSSPEEGRRALTLVPDHHVCIVPLDTVVELIPEAFERVTPDAPITMISGPSATSDIELERVEGVHGPRRLDVILLDRG